MCEGDITTHVLFPFTMNMLVGSPSVRGSMTQVQYVA